jgi:hypothetical protein
MTTPFESVRTRYELFSPLDATTTEGQRDELLRLFGDRALVDADNPDYSTNDPELDIAKIRFDGMKPYVESVAGRMRSSDVINIRITPGMVASDVFEKIAQSDSEDRPALFMRFINAERLDVAVKTGTDRDESSRLDYHDGSNEAQAIREYAIHDVNDFTYTTTIYPDDQPLQISEGQALLVYAVEAMQPLSLYKGNSHGSIGLTAFVDKRLKEKSLLAVITNAVDKAPAIGTVALTTIVELGDKKA